MALRVIFDRMTSAHDLAREIGVSSDLLTDAKESDLTFELIEQIEHLRGNERIGSIVNCDGELPGGRSRRRQAPNIRPDPRTARHKPRHEQYQMIDYDNG
jgi:hypothetical protein